MEKQKELINHHKPLIYILPKDSSNLNQIVSNTIQNVQEDYQSTAEADQEISVKIKTIADTITATASTLSAAALFSITPALLVAGGVAGALAITIVVSNTLKNKEESSNEENNDELTINKNEIEKILKKIDLSDWIDFVEQISFASIPEELDFPPGHPLPNRFYRVHPIKKKNNRYIPIERFDSLLYEERESELRKILVDLGATEIIVQETYRSGNQGSTEAKVSLEGMGGVSGGIDGGNEKSNLASEVITLKPKEWSPENFKRDQYSWLPYEPKWETMVHTRLEGGGLSYRIELTSDTSFSISAQLGLTEGILKNLASLGVESELSGLRQEKKVFEIKFVDV